MCVDYKTRNNRTLLEPNLESMCSIVAAVESNQRAGGNSGYEGDIWQ